jgi:hypothetical protein
VVDPVTRADRIGLSWVAPVFTGGVELLDYRLWYDNASGSVIDTVLEESLTSTEYVALDLTQGSVYQFKLEARNSEGFSFFSNIV